MHFIILIQAMCVFVSFNTNNRLLGKLHACVDISIVNDTLQTATHFSRVFPEVLACDVIIVYVYQSHDDFRFIDWNEACEA